MSADVPVTRRSRAAALVLVATLLAGCATPGARTPGQRLDPWENWNRKVFDFNEKLDARVVRPVAETYAKIVPRLARRGIDNFFNNFRDAWSGVNNVLQLKPGPAAHDFMRVGTNTVFGLGGLLDIASEIGLAHHYEDLGQTLGRWGVGPGAYLVLPLLGPSTVRDAAALPFDFAASPASIIQSGNAAAGITALRIVNARSNFLGASEVIDDIALDKYTFVRDAYLQRRRSLVLEGAGEGDTDIYAPADGDAPAVAPATAPGTAVNP